jgi:CelD/BcsL family acetyltransferase involved in cellulose biosynthesis
MTADSSLSVEVGRGERTHSLPPSRESPPQYTVETLTNEQELAHLAEDWNRVSAAAPLPNAFTTFDWYTAWNRHYAQQDGGGRRPHVLVLSKDGVTAGISPLILRTANRFGCSVRKLEFVGRNADYNDLVAGNDPEGQTEAIVSFLAGTRQQWDLVDLRNLRDTGETVPRILGALSRAGLIYRVYDETDGRCPYLSIDTPASEMVKKCSPGFRRGFAGKCRRLERMRAEGLRIRIIENPCSEPGLLAKMIAVEEERRVGKDFPPRFLAAYPAVFRSLFDGLSPRGWLFVALMELGDRPLAFVFGFRCGKRLWHYQTAFDRSFAGLSPGTMLLPWLFDYGFSHGYSEFDFLSGEEAYKTRWATGVHQTYRLLIWNKHWTSRVRAFVYLDLKPRVYRLFGNGE